MATAADEFFVEILAAAAALSTASRICAVSLSLLFSYIYPLAVDFPSMDLRHNIKSSTFRRNQIFLPAAILKQVMWGVDTSFINRQGLSRLLGKMDGQLWLTR